MKEERTHAATPTTSHLPPSIPCQSLTNLQTCTPNTAPLPSTFRTSFFVPHNALNAILGVKKSLSSSSSSSNAGAEPESSPAKLFTSAGVRSGLCSCTTEKITSFSASAMAEGPAFLISTEWEAVERTERAEAVDVRRVRLAVEIVLGLALRVRVMRW